jgi:hypothetical protein
MRKIIFIILVIFAVFFILNITDTVKDNLGYKFSKREKPEALPEYIGEKITYDVKFGSFRLGEAIFRRLENTKFEGKAAILMTFETKVTGFYDLETIYSDPNTFLPVRVTRKIDGLTLKEDIVEDYDQKKFILTLTKFKGKEKIDVQKFDNHGRPIYNAVSLPFYLRRIPKLNIGWKLVTQFGNLEYSIILISIENLETPLGIFEAYHFQSQPRKFEIWVTADKRRIPVKIKDTGILGYTLTMKGYSLEK